MSSTAAMLECGAAVTVWPLLTQDRGRWIDDGVIIEVVPPQHHLRTKCPLRRTSTDHVTRYLVQCATRFVLRSADQLRVVAP